MTLSMPQSRKVIRKQEEVAAALLAGLKARGVTRHSQREKLAQKAASSRPAELSAQARAAVANRRAIAMVERLQGGGL
ncbi:MAG TPA: hypothetical protein VGN60_07650 [Devosia sp.]|jgi:hypothetical protein|nr:hypothetical protein [Devosia sp.]